MTRTYDLAIVGAGVFGSWTAYHLQRRGLKLCLIDAYGAGNSRASSGGESRIIRMGYGTNEIYTRWSNQSLSWWTELSARTQPPLFHRTGVLWMAGPNDGYSGDITTTLQNVGIRFERLNRADLETRYPQINFDGIEWGIYEPESGALMARRAVQVLFDEVIKGGADYRRAAVLPLAESPRPSELVTADGWKVRAGGFIFACGPWLPKLFPDLLAERIHPTRQEVFFLGPPPGDPRFAAPRMPIWIDFGNEAYGLPDLENRGFKVGIDRHGPSIDPDLGERHTTAEILNEARNYLAHRIPGLKHAPLLESRVCQYENTSNGDFLIDRHPNFENVWLVGGGSGHGFKHGPALGEYVAELITEELEVLSCFSLQTKTTFRERAIF
ncbi:MAG TPA: FAD-dependent oxidoreductase [Blastocatellia bacterium]|nr:FAD-dependent oxidoreductase [Blastocatellia bacterium]